VKRRVWIPALLLVLVAVVSVVALAQDRKGPKYPDHEQLLREVHAALKQGVGCTETKGTMSFGQNLSSSTSTTSCIESINQGAVYIDFWALQVPTGHTVEIEANSSLEYLAAIQDFTTGTVLASTLNCGLSNHPGTCSFTYTVQAGGTVLVSIGTINSTGLYTLLATDLTGGAPTPTVIPATPTPPPQSGCATSSLQACLGGQYTVSVHWDTTDGRSGDGTPVPLSADTAYFWFFNSANVELTVKVLDGHAINGHVWVFYGALSNVHYVITVTDTVSGTVRRYENPQGTMASVGDTSAF
jgi:hypothetical protein